MAGPEHKTTIMVALIGLAGVLGAALISNPEILRGEPPARVATPDATLVQPGPAATPPTAIEAPHAPPIRMNNVTEVWGENTRLLSIAPGDEIAIDGRDLFSHVATFPDGGCAGPAFIAYTWQVRDPYPNGGDLEIKAVYMGGGTEQVALGAKGSAVMGTCDIRIFKNNALVTTKVEVRYASAHEQLPELRE